MAKRRRVKRDPWFSSKPKRQRRRRQRQQRGGSLSPTERVGAEAFSGKL